MWCVLARLVCVLMCAMCRVGICEQKQMFSQRVHGACSSVWKSCARCNWCMCWRQSFLSSLMRFVILHPHSSQWIGIQVVALQTLKLGYSDWREYRKTGNTIIPRALAPLELAIYRLSVCVLITLVFDSESHEMNGHGSMKIFKRQQKHTFIFLPLTAQEIH